MVPSEMDKNLRQALIEVLSVSSGCKTYLEGLGFTPSAEAVISMVDIVIIRAGCINAEDAEQ